MLVADNGLAGFSVARLILAATAYLVLLLVSRRVQITRLLTPRRARINDEVHNTTQQVTETEVSIYPP